MTKKTLSKVTRRQALKTGAAAAAVGAAGPALTGTAFAGAEGDRIIAAAKAAVPGGVDVSGIMWSNYQVATSGSIKDFGDATNIKLPKIQDISTFEIPQRAMAEALSKSPEFDFFHVDSNMIPSLASAGLLEPLDEYMKKADFKIEDRKSVV